MTSTYRADNRRIPELDGFRVLLVFIVSWYHIWQQSWLTPRIGTTSLDFLVRTGYMPVDGTILLSGFLLFLPYARAMQQGGKLPDRRDFYRRRAMRILPSYYFLLTAVLLAVVIPFGLYRTPQAAVKDIFMHLTFTFMFSADTYMATPLGAACWTLALEMQAYLLFPFAARQVMKRPGRTLGAMVLAAFAWRGFCLWSLREYGMVVNQLPSFLDVYALGMLCAMVYVRMTSQPPRRPWLRQLAATAVLALCLWLLIPLLRVQAFSPNQIAIQRGQLLRRFPYALLLAGIMMSLPFAVRPVRFLMGNRAMGFLAGISLNYYLIHQIVAVHLKRLGIPPSESPTPHFDMERPWQLAYTAMAFGISLLLAILVTYLVEKPGARWMQRLFQRRDARSAERLQARAVQAVRDKAHIQPGERVLLEAFHAKEAYVAALVRAVCDAGGELSVQLRAPQVDAALLAAVPSETRPVQLSAEAEQLEAYQVYIGVGDVPLERLQACDAQEGLRMVLLQDA